MTKENTENLDSQNEELDEQDNELENPEEDLEEDSEEMRELKEKNRQLFARTKKAEGFVQREGKWVKPEPTKEEKPKPKESDKETPDIDELVEKKLNERFETQALETLNLQDDLKEEVRKLSQLKGISVGEAVNDPYIQHRKEEIERQARVVKATPRRSKKGAPAPSYDPSKPLNPSDFDMNTEEGVKEWTEAKAVRRNWEQDNS